MSQGYYKLLPDHSIEPADLEGFCKVCEDAEGKRVALYENDGVKVSTVFLGLDHSFGEGAPLLFETMIFGGPNDQYQDRYSTWDEAIAGHERALNMVKPT